MRHESPKGKGNVVRRMFADIEADVYVLVDGDDTYDAHARPGMVERLETELLDMVIGCAFSPIPVAYRPGHRFGNALLSGLCRPSSASAYATCCPAIEFSRAAS